MEARTGDRFQTVMLAAHSADEPGPARAVTVHFEPREGELWLRFVVEGKVDDLIWPQAAAPVRTDDLWATTCLEDFVETTDGYVEFNLSP